VALANVIASVFTGWEQTILRHPIEYGAGVEEKSFHVGAGQKQGRTAL
jgi:hypothetical protein